MAGFFLYKKHLNIDIEDLKQIFSRKGLRLAQRFNLGNYILLNFGNEKIIKNFHEFAGVKIFVYGTLIYKGLAYHDMLKRLAIDISKNEFSTDDLSGNFFIIYFDETTNNTKFFSDPSGLFHVFATEDDSIISSSLIAILVGKNKKSLLNKDELLLRLLIGYSLDSQTIFHDIRRIKGNISNLNLWRNCIPASKKKDIEKFVIEYLIGKFHKISDFLHDAAVNIGLSGGYDSRLLLALAQKSRLNAVFYTYSDDAHQQELDVVRAISLKTGIKVNEIALKSFKEFTQEEFIKNLDDSVFFYDGRTNKSMGGYRELFTLSTRKRILDGKLGEINGLGGEIFRNYENLPNRGIRTDCWIKFRLFSPHGIRSFPNSTLLNKFVDKVKERIASQVGDQIFREKITLRTTRLFFSKIWVPGHIGVRVSTENQIGYFLTPFAEYDVQMLMQCYNDFLGINGEFEAKLIKILDDKLAEVNSIYGHNFTQLSVKTRLSYKAKKFIPECTRLKMHFLLGSYRLEYFQRLSEKFPIVNEILGNLTSLKLPINLHWLTVDPESVDRLLFWGYFLMRFSDYIST